MSNICSYRHCPGREEEEVPFPGYDGFQLHVRCLATMQEQRKQSPSRSHREPRTDRPYPEDPIHYGKDNPAFRDAIHSIRSMSNEDAERLAERMHNAGSAEKSLGLLHAALDPRPSWAEYFFAIAEVVSRRATCPRASVGVVIVSQDHRILSTGYNGAPPREPHCLTEGCQMADKHCQRSLHAEVNAITWGAKSGTALGASDMYIFMVVPQNSTTEMPCRECEKVIKAAGLRQVHTRKLERGENH